MINLFRRNQQVLMILVTVVVIITFIWLYNRVSFEKLGAENVARIYGRSITRTEAERQLRKFNLALDLGLHRFVSSLAAVGPHPGEEGFLWNLIVVKHEADQLELQPDNDAVIARIQQLPVFQTNGSFDPQKFALFSEKSLSPRGFTQAQLEELIREEMRVEQIKKLLGATVTVTPAELRGLYEREYGKLEVALVRLKREDFMEKVDPTQEELAREFEQRKASLNSEEKRSVRVAKFAISKEDAAKQGRERIDILQKTANTAQDFAEAASAPGADFQALAKAAGGETYETPLFSQTKPPPELGGTPAAAAFELSKDHPHSEVIQAGDAFYVLSLGDVEPSRPLTFEEARSSLIEQIKAQRAEERMNLKAAEIRKAIAEAMSQGKSFVDAARAAGQAAEVLPPFSPAEPDPKAPENPAVLQTAMRLKEGQISEPVPTAEGVLLVCLQRKIPIDEQKFESERDRLTALVRRSKTEIAFAEWLRVRLEAAGLQTTVTR